MSNFKFSVKTKSVPVTLEDENGNEVVYQVHQLTGATADALRAAQAAKLVLDSDGNVKEIKDFTGQYTELLARCLKDPKGNLVSKEELNSWPDGALEGLHDIAADLNGMKAKEVEDDSKNS
jgi:hypothetical protein